MLDKELVTVTDPKLIDEMEVIVRETAVSICAEQPDVAEPQDLNDLDSFSMVQVLLELENLVSLKLLERMETFKGETFRDLAVFILRVSVEVDNPMEEGATEDPATENAVESAGSDGDLPPRGTAARA